MVKFIIFLICIVLFKFVLNFSKYLRCKKLSDEHLLWVSNGEGNFMLHKGQVLDLFKGSNIAEGSIPISEPAGYGLIASYSLPLFSNLDSRRADVACVVNGYFNHAMGTYHHRAFEALNPLYWLESLVFLPKRILQYVGFDTEKPAAKLCNVLLTFLWWIVCVIFLFFRPQIVKLILAILD